MDPGIAGAFIGWIAGTGIGLVAVTVYDWWTEWRSVRRYRHLLYVPPLSLHPPLPILKPGRGVRLPAGRQPVQPQREAMPRPRPGRSWPAVTSQVYWGKPGADPRDPTQWTPIGGIRQAYNTLRFWMNSYAHGPCTCPRLPWTPHKHCYRLTPKGLR